VLKKKNRDLFLRRYATIVYAGFVGARTGINGCDERDENYHFHGVISRTRALHVDDGHEIRFGSAHRAGKEKNISLASFVAVALMRIISPTKSYGYP